MKIVKQLSILQEEGILLTSINESKNRFRVYYIFLGTTPEGNPYIHKKWGRLCFHKGKLYLSCDRWNGEETHNFSKLDLASKVFQLTINQKFRKGYKEIPTSELNYSIYTQLSIFDHINPYIKEDQSKKTPFFEQMTLLYA